MVVVVKLITGEDLTFKLDKDSCVIGRSGSCDVVIPHESISRRHCQIDYRDGELFVTDLGSINGVTLDGQKITPNKPVKFQSFFALAFGAVQSMMVDIPEERTSVQVNPLLATTLPKEKPRPAHRAQSSSGKSVDLPANMKKNDTAKKDQSMNNFVILCVVVVLGFALFIFREEIMSLLE
ncbi:MAG: FHA domain-containing protein [Bdellovibrionota bacterium]